MVPAQTKIGLLVQNVLVGTGMWILYMPEPTPYHICDSMLDLTSNLIIDLVL
jgi:hypothetical protein